jgi:hypothetical protein
MADAFKRLYAFDEERIEQVNEMLSKGLPASQVAQVIQSEWGLLADLKPDSVKKMLERYRKTDLRECILAQVAGVTEGMHTTTLAKRVSALEELTDLATVQKGRYQKAVQLEAGKPLLLKQATEEGRLLKEILVELGRLQLDTGVLARVPRRITGQVIDEGGRVRQFEWTEEQEALYREIDAGRLAHAEAQA